ncbi:MAG: hypothetical protein MZV64_28995 [Ignavibacteriales bacterium]|nr:hypothetical protein [Ignavibacteriales bacterium]
MLRLRRRDLHDARSGRRRTPPRPRHRWLADARSNNEVVVPVSGGAREFAVSPNGKEIAVVVRGGIFAASVDGGVDQARHSPRSATRRVRLLLPRRERHRLRLGARRPLGHLRDAPDPRRGALFLRLDRPQGDAARRQRAPERLARLFSRRQGAGLHRGPGHPQGPQPRHQADADAPDRPGARPRRPTAASTSAWSPDGQLDPLRLRRARLRPGEVGLIKADGTGKAVNLTESGFNDRPGQVDPRRPGHDLGQQPRRHEGRGLQRRRAERRLRPVLHPGRLGPLPPDQGRSRAPQGDRGEEGQTRCGQGQEGARREGEEGGGQAARDRLGRPGPAQGPPDHPLLLARRRPGQQGRRHALLPGPLREGHEPLDDQPQDARDQDARRPQRQRRPHGLGQGAEVDLPPRRRLPVQDRPLERQARHDRHQGRDDRRPRGRARRPVRARLAPGARDVLPGRLPRRRLERPQVRLPEAPPRHRRRLRLHRAPVRDARRAQRQPQRGALRPRRGERRRDRLARRLLRSGLRRPRRQDRRGPRRRPARQGRPRTSTPGHGRRGRRRRDRSPPTGASSVTSTARPGNRSCSPSRTRPRRPRTARAGRRPTPRSRSARSPVKPVSPREESALLYRRWVLRNQAEVETPERRHAWATSTSRA